MINQNGIICKQENVKISIKNRALKYGDSVFETLKINEGKVLFLEDHYFRLMASLHLLRMEAPMHFNLEFFEQEILNTVHANAIVKQARVRITVYRKKGGFYAPKSNEIAYIVEASALELQNKEHYVLELYKDYYINSGLLSTIKTNNRIINVLGSIFASENDFDNCILLNEKKHIVEALNGNIFLVQGNHIKTPKLSDGCVNGILRKNLIALLKESDKFSIEEASISPFEIQKSDEVFITNSIIGIQPVSRYKKKIYTNKYSLQLKNRIASLS